MKETNFFVHEISPNQAICKHFTLCLLNVFLSLSNIVLFKHDSQKYP